MMRTLIAVLLLVAASSAYAALRAADEAKAEQKEAGGRLAARIQDLNLTDQQEAKIAEIREQFKPKVQEAAKALAAVAKEEMAKAQAVLTPEQQKKLQEFKEERKEFRAESLCERLANLEQLDLTDAEITKIADIRKEYRPKIEKALEGLKGLLSEEQKKAREQAFDAGMKRKEMLAALKLTDAQKEKVATIGKEVATLFRDEMEKVRDVLTASQQEKLDELKDERKEHVRDRMAHRIAHLKELKLTPDQTSKLMEIRKEFRPRVHEAGNHLREIVRQEVSAILAAIKG
jgi:Spy/CpxP family protein refolding chaperone